MKKLSIALAATFMLSNTAPLMAAEIDVVPVAPTCMEKLQSDFATYDPVHAFLFSPIYLVHAVGCHVFHKNG